MATAPAEWFEIAIVDGMQRLHALRLTGTPAGEIATLSAQTWIEVLWSGEIAWLEDRDKPRLTAAFLHLGRICERWPAPRQLLEVLPRAAGNLRIEAPVPQRSAKVGAIVESMKSMLKTNNQRDPLNWARKIAQRVEDGDQTVALIAKQWAAEVLATERAPAEPEVPRVSQAEIDESMWAKAARLRVPVRHGEPWADFCKRVQYAEDNPQEREPGDDDEEVAR